MANGGLREGFGSERRSGGLNPSASVGEINHDTSEGRGERADGERPNEHF